MTLEERHIAAVNKLQDHLFRDGYERYRADHGTVEVIPHTLTKALNREPTLGGLKFSLLIPGKRYTVEVTHATQAMFHIAVFDENKETFTRFAVTVPFHEVPAELERLVGQL